MRQDISHAGLTLPKFTDQQSIGKESIEQSELIIDQSVMRGAPTLSFLSNTPEVIMPQDTYKKVSFIDE